MANMDMNKALRIAANTGTVLFGQKETKAACRDGKAKLVVYADNAPGKDFGEVRIYRYPGSNADLGAACGKPFSVSCLAIIEAGDSQVLSV